MKSHFLTLIIWLQAISISSDFAQKNGPQGRKLASEEQSGQVEKEQKERLKELHFKKIPDGYYHLESYEFFEHAEDALFYADEVISMKEQGQWARHLQDVRAHNKRDLEARDEKLLGRGRAFILNNDLGAKLTKEGLEDYQQLQKKLAQNQFSDQTSTYSDGKQKRDEKGMTESQKSKYHAGRAYFKEKKDAKMNALWQEFLALKEKKELTTNEQARLEELLTMFPRELLSAAVFAARISDSQAYIQSFLIEMKDFALSVIGSKEQRANLKEAYGREGQLQKTGGRKLRRGSQKKQRKKVILATGETPLIPYLKKLYFQADNNNYWNTEEKNNFYISFHQKKFLDMIDQAINIKKKLAAFTAGSETHEAHKFNLLMVYTTQVYSVVRGFLRYFDRDPSQKSKNIRDNILQSLLPEMAKDLVNEDTRQRFIKIGLELVNHPTKANVYHLQLGPIARLNQDLMYFLYIPSSHFYLQATKLATLKAMLARITTYNIMVGDKNYFQAPGPCLLRQGANFPKEMTTNQMNPEEQRDAVTNSLINMGLIRPKQHIQEESGLLIDDSSLENYNNYYMDNLETDIMTRHNYSAARFNPLFPFEKYFNARKALKILEDGGRFYNGYGRILGTASEFKEVLLDDHDSKIFEDIIQIKTYELAKVLKNVRPRIPKRSFRHAHHAQAKAHFEKIQNMFQDLYIINKSPCLKSYTSHKLYCFAEAEKIKANKKKWQDRYEIINSTTGVSKYLINKIQKSALKSPAAIDLPWWDHIDPSVWEKASKNIIRMDMPSLYSNDSWRRWGFKTLYHFLKERRDHSKLAHIIKKLCIHKKTWAGVLCNKDPKSVRRFGKKILPRSTIQRLLTILGPLVDDESSYTINLSQTDFNKLSPIMPFMTRLWQNAQCKGTGRCLQLDQSFMPGTFIDEKNFILAQGSNNHWAMARISYLDAYHHLKNIEGSHLSSFYKLGKVLKLTRPLHHFQSNNVLDHGETVAIYKSIIATFDEGNNYILQTKDQRGKSYYEHLQDIFRFNFFTPDAFSKADKRFRFLKSIVVSKKFTEDKKRAQAHSYQDLESQMQEIVKERGNPAAQLEVFRTFDETRQFTSDSLKRVYLTLENRYKTPYYRQLVRKSAHHKRDSLTFKMSQLCALKPDESTVAFNNLFYLTSKAQMNFAQNKENKIEVPKKVQDRIDSFSDADWKVLWLGLGSGVGYGLVAYAFTAVALTPVGAAFILAAALGAGTVQIKSALTEKKQGDISKVSAELVRSFADDQLTDEKNADQVSRSYGWAALEAAFVIPFIGLAGKSIQLVTRGTKAKRALFQHFKSLKEHHLGHQLPKKELKKMKKEAHKLASFQAQAQSEALYAKYLLQIEKFGLKKLAPNNVKKIFSRELFENIIVGETKGQIDNHFSKVFVKWFRGNPKYAVDFFNSYGNHQSTLKRAFQRHAGASPGTPLFHLFDSKLAKSQRALLNHEATLANEHAGWGMKKFAAWRAKKLQKFLSASDDLEQVLKDLKTLKGEAEFSKYIRKNSAKIANIIDVIPYKKRHLPHAFMAMGSPAIVTPIPIWSSLRHVPLLKGWSDGVVLKRMVAAREILLAERIAEIHRMRLIKAGVKGISSGINTHDHFTAYHSYRQGVSLARAKLEGVALKNYTQGTDAHHHRISQNVYDHYLKRTKSLPASTSDGHSTLTYPEFAKLLDRQDAFAQSVFNNTPAKIIFGDGTNIIDDKSVYKTFKALSDFNSINGIDPLWATARMLIQFNHGELIHRF